MNSKTEPLFAMPTAINPKLVPWASDIEPETIRQAEKTARPPIVEGQVALMPDAHVGIGATVGSVIPSKAAVIPSAVGAPLDEIPAAYKDIDPLMTDQADLVIILHQC